VRLGNGAEEVEVGLVLGATVIGMEVTIVEPCELVVVRFAKEVAVEDAVLLVVVAALLETSLVVVVSGGVEREDCAEEGVGE
jgi:hypothetical protein